MASHNLKLAFEQFSQADSVKTKKRLSITLKFVLKQYALPLWKGQKYTDREIESHFEDCLAKISIEEFRHPPLIEDVMARELQALVADGKLKRGTADNYRSALNKFIKWMQSQDWYLETVETENAEAQPSLFKSRDLRAARRKQKEEVRKKLPSLYPCEIPLRLERQIEARPNELKVEDFGFQLQQKFQQQQWQLPKTGLRYFCLLKPGLFQETASNPSVKEQIENLVNDVYRFFWWQKKIQNQSLDRSELADMTNPDLLSQHIAWRLIKRDYSNYGSDILSSASIVSQWLYHLTSHTPFLRDIEEFSLLSKILQKSIATKILLTQGSNHVVPEEKYLSIEECEKILLELRRDCELKDVRGLPRTNRAVMQSWQRYLVSALTCYAGLRPHEIRQLRISQLDFKENIGDCVVAYLDFQDNAMHGRHTLFPNFIVKDLKNWITTWRNRINPGNNFVFISLGANNKLDSEGQPLDNRAVNAMLSRAIYKHSGKIAAPSMLRRFAALRLVPISSLSKSLLHEMLEIELDLSDISSTEGTRKFFSQILLRDRIIKDLGLSFNDSAED